MVRCLHSRFIRNTVMGCTVLGSVVPVTALNLASLHDVVVQRDGHQDGKPRPLSQVADNLSRTEPGNVLKRSSDDDVLGDPYAIYYGRSMLRVKACTPDEATQIRAILRNCQSMTEAGFIRHPPKGGNCTTELTICRNESAKLLIGSFDAEVLTIDAGGSLRNQSGLVERWQADSMDLVAARQRHTNGIFEDTSFYTKWRKLSDIEDRIKQVVKLSHGSIVTMDSLSPKTWENRTISVVRFRGADWVTDKPRVVLTCQLHAREWVAGMTCTKIIDNLVKRVQEDPGWFRDLELVVIPIANPDGFAHASNKDRFWRKNRNPNKNSESNPDHCVGVDLNRNFDKDWGGEESTSRDPCEDVHVGKSPRSEPEAKALASVFDEAPVTVHLDLHSYGGYILGPWDFTNDNFPRKDESDRLGFLLQTAISGVHNQKYEYGCGSEVLYLASGSFSDFSSDHCALGFTLELRPVQDSALAGLSGFSPPPAVILPSAEEAQVALDLVVKQAKKIGNGRIKKTHCHWKVGAPPPSKHLKSMGNDFL